MGGTFYHHHHTFITNYIHGDKQLDYHPELNMYTTLITQHEVISHKTIYICGLFLNSFPKHITLQQKFSI